MWKAFDEMQKLGWIGSERPRLFTVQAEGCAPIVRAFEAGSKFAPEFLNAHTVASGLRVPRAIGDFIMLDALRRSGGGVVAVSDAEMLSCVREIGAAEGIFAAPEGAACYAGMRKLLAAGTLNPEESVVLFNTSSGLKYLECFDQPSSS
jgi:threonine synthase